MICRAQVVVAQPLSVVESHLWDVGSWPTFLGRLDSAVRVTHERYTVLLRQAWHSREALIRVRWHAREHRVSWHTQGGPTWFGEFALTAIGDRSTAVTLTTSPVGEGVAAALDRYLAVRERGARPDLERLSRRLALLPQTARPGRCVPAPGNALQDLVGVYLLAVDRPHTRH